MVTACVDEYLKVKDYEDANQTTRHTVEGLLQILSEYAFNNIQDYTPRYNHWNEEMKLLFNSTALCGEAGEVADAIKKYVALDGGREAFESLVEELGDTLFHMFVIMQILRIPLREILEVSIAKTKRLREQSLRLREEGLKSRS